MTIRCRLGLHLWKQYWRTFSYGNVVDRYFYHECARCGRKR